MDIPITQPPGYTAEPELRFFKLSTDQYHAMARAGILTADDRVELLSGWLVVKMTIHPPHSVASEELAGLLRRLVTGTHLIRHAQPVTLESDSEPAPDVAVVRGARADFRGRHPGAGEIPLVVEVADASLARDRGIKKRIYAHNRIPVYWIVNLIDRQVEVYTQPAGADDQADYRARYDYGPGDDVPVVIDGDEVGRVAVRALLP